MDNFYDKLFLEKKKRKLTNADLGKAIGKNADAFRMALSRKKLSDLEKEKLSNLFGLENDSENMKVSEPTLAYKSLNQKVKVPYYNIEFTASFLESFNSQQAEPDSFITHPFFENCDYVVRNSGQSMAKLIKHGDAIGLKKIENWQEFLPLGEIYAIVTTNGFRMVKIITQGKDDDHYTLVSKPSDGKKHEFPDQQIKKSMILHIFRVEVSSHKF